MRSIQDRAQDTSKSVDSDWFLKTKGELLGENANVWKNQTLLWEMIFLFIEGKQLLRQSRYGRGWRSAPLPYSTDAPVYALNLVGFYSDNIKAKWTQSNTDVNWRPTSDADESIGAAKAAQMIHDFYKRKLYTPNFRQTEAMLAQCGKYARYYFMSDDQKRKARRPKVTKQQVDFPGAWFCADCGEGGDGSLSPPPTMDQNGYMSASGPVPAHDEVGEWAAGEELPHPPELEAMEGTAEAEHLGVPAPACPACGSPNVEQEGGQPLEVEALEGYEEFEVGDICCENVPAFELKHDLAKNPQDSPYLIRQRRVRTAILESKFPFLKIKAAKSEAAGLSAEDDLKKSTYGGQSPYSRFAEGADTEPTTDFVQVWLDPSMYTGIKLNAPLLTLSGQEIPAGTLLTDTFPDGMYMAWVEGVEGCVELRNEHHRDYWVGQVYRMRAISSLGTGIEDMIEGQRQYNLIMSIIYTQLRTAAMPATLFDERLLPNGTSSYLGSLQNIPVNLTPLEGKRLQDAVYQLQPQPPTQQHFAYSQQLDYFLQKSSRVTDFSGGLPGVNNSTATGAQIASANSQSLFAPQLALKAEVDRVGAQIIVNLFKKNFMDEVYLNLSGKRGEQDGIWLSAADIGLTLYAEVVGDSYLPQTNLERRERWRGLLMDIGGMPGLKMALAEMPALVEELTTLYDVDLGSDDYTTAAEMCRVRIDQMKAAEPLVAMQQQAMPPTAMEVDPMTGQAMEVPVDPNEETGQMLLSILVPPIELEEVGHLAAINYYRSWLTEDEGRKASPGLRAAVKGAIAQHLQGMMVEAQITGAVGMAGQPMPAGPPPGDGGEKPKNQNPDDKQMKPATAWPSPKPQAGERMPA